MNDIVGLVHIYTGNGKGKTTCAVGLGLRFAGTGGIVNMIQFFKNQDSAELESLSKIPTFKVFRFTSPYISAFTWQMNSDELKELEQSILKSWISAKHILENKSCEMLILDEIMLAINSGFIDVDDVVNSLNNRPSDIEVVLTGRDAPDKLIDVSDYVSDITCVKHPLENNDKGQSKIITARKGIEY